MASEGTVVVETCDTWACAFTHVYDEGGVLVLVLFGLCFLFYRLIWRVWRTMIRSKDEEIERLTDERNFYQRRLFPDRVSSDCPSLKSDLRSRVELETKHTERR